MSGAHNSNTDARDTSAKVRVRPWLLWIEIAQPRRSGTWERLYREGQTVCRLRLCVCAVFRCVVRTATSWPAISMGHSACSMVFSIPEMKRTIGRPLGGVTLAKGALLSHSKSRTPVPR